MITVPRLGAFRPAAHSRNGLSLLLRLGLVGALLLTALSLAPLARAEHANWLNEPLNNWNGSGQSVPRATPPAIEGGFDLDDSDVSRCERLSAASAAEQAVTAAGWALFAPSQTGTGKAGSSVEVVWGTAGYDGMCRSWGFNGFVFVNGWFAGTISPVEMYARIDGVVQDVDIQGATLWATFTRYADSDPLCCPSLEPISVEYRTYWGDEGPFLWPVDKLTGRHT